MTLRTANASLIAGCETLQQAVKLIVPGVVISEPSVSVRGTVYVEFSLRDKTAIVECKSMSYDIEDGKKGHPDNPSIQRPDFWVINRVSVKQASHVISWILGIEPPNEFREQDFLNVWGN